jgi:hypothetical protein
MNTQRNIYDAGSPVSPAISDLKGTWFLGRETKTACAESLKGIGPMRKRNTSTWFLGRKASSV